MLRIPNDVLPVTVAWVSFCLLSGGPAAAQSSGSWQQTCYNRCGGKANCTPSCDRKFSQCMKSGCFTEGQAFGGARHCGLPQN